MITSFAIAVSHGRLTFHPALNHWRIIPMLKAKFVKPDKSFKGQHSVPLKIILTNTGKQDLSVLTRNTPLDGLVTDCLDVTVNGKKVEYDGPIVKRAPPTASDYTLIKAGQSVEAEFVVSDAYDTSRPGTYKVKLKTPILDARPKEAKLAAALKSIDFVPKVHAIKDQTSFKVEKGAALRLTLGAAARSKEAAKMATAKVSASTLRSAVKKKPSAKTLLTPVISGGTATKKAAARKAHTAGHGLCVNALAALRNDPHYVEWFGAYTAARFKKVTSNYTAVKTRMESVPFTYDLSGSGCGSGVFAYTYKGTSTIWFCDQFWAAAATGTDSKAGTVVHEHTHSDASTDDNVYGQAACRSLAISQPGKAIENADSHEYFAGG